MRSKIRCDGESYKILEFWMQLNKDLVPKFFWIIGSITLQLLRVGEMLLQLLILEICYSHMSFNTLGPPAGYVSLWLFCMDRIALM